MFCRPPRPVRLFVCSKIIFRSAKPKAEVLGRGERGKQQVILVFHKFWDNSLDFGEGGRIDDGWL